MTALPNCLCIGTGEYTTGYVCSVGQRDGEVTQSDKRCGVVALVMFDLRARGQIGPRVGLCGTSGIKFPAIRAHLQRAIGDVYKGIGVHCETFPADDVTRDPQAYEKALDKFSPGDIVSIFTPDDTHYAIALAAIERGMHVILTKPPVKTVVEHLSLVKRAREKNVIVVVEVHKRYDPVYDDARNRIRNLGPFNYFYAYMSQPKGQLATFKSWAGISSDISYYLNSHHIDFHAWALTGIARPTLVSAVASNGIANKWVNLAAPHSAGTAVYTASWAAAKADVHSQQRFFYLGASGEVSVDQAHRGYTAATDADGFASVNPLYMRYVPDHQGRFVGQQGYGYQSFSRFVEAVHMVREGSSSPQDFNAELPTLESTLTVTAILEAVVFTEPFIGILEDCTMDFCRRHIQCRVLHVSVSVYA
ncbi:unnamed protein product (mitochondrion) [Plasmodiophora brassicae]|uniref:Gfo/Idh/MocA-like oxidoreductase N-terminal domain-containing protein n=1 Tax=Plasmodiophora brassicae TaxID=37360 RepID=A0A3P3XZ92_PLABS|nr:unnamed protein product [Plasmodiophora brassicae]